MMSGHVNDGHAKLRRHREVADDLTYYMQREGKAGFIPLDADDEEVTDTFPIKTPPAGFTPLLRRAALK